MPDEEQTLLEVADAVASGTPVDWMEISRSNTDLDLQLAQLQLVERIRAVHRRGATITIPDNVLTLDPDQDLASTLSSGTWGPLELIEEIGEGRCGKVYRAYDPKLQKHVALKLLRDEDDLEDSDFLNEARRMARVCHKNVLMIHGVDCHDDRCGLWTELIEGRSLEDVIQGDGPMSAEEASRIGIAVCRALAAVHQHRLIHGDVKTTNIMRETGGRIVLMDFSSVRDVRPGLERDYLSTGTPLYMAPELLDGVGASTASDLYALGVVLYRLTTAQFPVTASSYNELCKKHRLGQRVPLRNARPDLPDEFVRIVEKALDPEPGRRYANAGEFERELAQKRKPPWKMVALVAGSALMAVAAVLLGLWLSQFFKPFEVEAELYRQGEAMEQRLLNGAPVELGDALFLRIEGNKRMHVYAFNTDETGQPWLLYPLDALAQKNPLEAGVLHELPGDQAWTVDTRGGTETFFVIAATRSLEELEQELASFPQAGGAVAVKVDSERLIPVVRGITGLTPRTDTPDTRTQLADILQAVSAEGARRGGVWTWRIELRGPESP